MERGILAAGLIGIAILAGPAVSAEATSDPPDAPTPLGSVPGWTEDDEAAALGAFRRTCRVRRDPALRAPCSAAMRLRSRNTAAARRFFERWFDPVRVRRPDGSDGFLTGYYEPEVEASPTPRGSLQTPLLARPPNLVVIETGTRPAGWPEGLTAALLTPAGFMPLPDRAGIETDGLAGARPIAYLDPVDAFMVQVQGSARLRLPGGQVLRVGFDGRNGYPYTGIGRVVAEREGLSPASMTADRLVAWLRDHPAEAIEVMRQNRSYIFFRRQPAAGPGEGPIGAAGVPLTPGRSLAVDRAATPFGTPVWLDGELPVGGGGTTPLRRLVVADDAGAAITGPARGDLFLGSGEAAGAVASLLRHPVAWTELRPRARPRPSSP